MTVKIEKRLAAFEDTILAAVKKYGISVSESDANGLTREDFVAILRVSVWQLLEEQDDASREYVCKAIWNRARDLLRARGRRKNRSYTIDSQDMEDALVAEASNPWADCDMRMDIQKLFDTLSPEDVQILWMVAEHGRGKVRGQGNKEVSQDLGISPRTLSRRLVRARETARETLPAYAVQKERNA